MSVSSTHRASSAYTFVMFDDYKLAKGMTIWLHRAAISDAEFDRLLKSGAYSDSSINGGIASWFLSTYGIECVATDQLHCGPPYTAPANYKIVYSFKEGIGRPRFNYHSPLGFLDMKFCSLYDVRLQLIVIRTNKVVAEVTFHRNRLGPHDWTFASTMVDMLYNKGAVPNTPDAATKKGGRGIDK